MKKSRVLIAEDEMVTAIFLKKIFEEAGCSVIDLVSSGEAVLESVRMERPDLIVMDILLEGKLDGIDTIMKIQCDQDIPVVYITASTDDESIRRALTTRPLEYLAKPIQVPKVQMVVNKINEMARTVPPAGKDRMNESGSDR